MANSEIYNMASYTFLVLTFLIPIVVKAKKYKLFDGLSLSKLTLTINKATVLQILVAIIFLTLAIVFDKTICSKGRNNNATDFYMNVIYAYVFVGLFIYLPFVGILNLVRYFANR